MTGALAILVASLLGSPHCAAMCGPFVAFYAGSPGMGDQAPRVHGAYSLGRLVAYALLGTLAGALGSGLDRAGTLAGIGRPAAVAAGALMIAWGASTILATRGVRVGVLHPPRWMQRAVTGVLSRVRVRPPVVRALVTGLATALLPCGWLYVFVAAAAGSGSAVRGAAMMTVFWTGTLPVMVSMGLGIQRLARPLRARLPVVTAAAVVALGIFTIATRLRSDLSGHQMAAPHAVAR